jgi:hypothetical protein
MGDKWGELLSDRWDIAKDGLLCALFGIPYTYVIMAQLVSLGGVLGFMQGRFWETTGWVLG